LRLLALNGLWLRFQPNALLRITTKNQVFKVISDINNFLLFELSSAVKKARFSRPFLTGALLHAE
jgi:hypothetical protein